MLSPRWITWHLLTLGAMVTCGLLSAWQWSRAESITGSALNIGYGLQWPLFAVFFGVMWYRMLRLEIRRLRGEQPDEVASPVLGPSATGARAAAGAQGDTAAALNGAAAAGAEPAAAVTEAVASDPRRPGVDSRPASSDSGSAGADPRLADADARLAGPSPFTPSPATAPPPITDETDPELAAYNRMLAVLAERDQARAQQNRTR